MGVLVEGGDRQAIRRTAEFFLKTFQVGPQAAAAVSHGTLLMWLVWVRGAPGRAPWLASLRVCSWPPQLKAPPHGIRQAAANTAVSCDLNQLQISTLHW